MLQQAAKTVSTQQFNTSLWNCTGEMNTVLTKDFSSNGVLMMVMKCVV